MAKLEGKVPKIPGMYADIVHSKRKLSGAEKSLIELGASRMHNALKPRIRLTEAENNRLRIQVSQLQTTLSDALHLGSFPKNPVVNDWLVDAWKFAAEDQTDEA